MMDILMTTGELEARLNDPKLVLMDCRFDLTDPDWGKRDYLSEHIPGAVFAHMDTDLAGPASPMTGRHPLPEPAAFCALASRWGIDGSKEVVVYDTNFGGFSSRLWWLLRFYGHQNVRLLEGGLIKWLREERPVRSGEETNSPATFIGEPRTNWVVDTREVEILRQRSNYLLIDSRAFERYCGLNETIDPVAGHIPGAVNRSYQDNLTPDGTFKPKDELKAEFKKVLRGIPPSNSVIYCGSGVTSCFNLFAMELAGLHGARLYAGSWSEWIRDPNRPIATGEK